MDMKKVFGVLLICLLSACASKGTQPSAEVEDKSRGATAPSEESTRGMEATPTLNPLTDPNNILSRRSVYFDFDSYVVKDEYKSLVVAHAQYLRDNGNARALVQGHTDERGRSEEHTSELQSPCKLVCRLLHEQKKPKHEEDG